MEARLHNEQDVDLFEVQIEDSYTNLFNLEVALESIPEGAIYALEVFSADTGGVFYSNSGSSLFGWKSKTRPLTMKVVLLSLQSGPWGTDCLKQYALLIDYLEWGGD